MSEQELAKFEAETRKRLRDNLGSSDDKITLVINMVASFHSTRGAALYAINDFLDRKGL